MHQMAGTALTCVKTLTQKANLLETKVQPIAPNDRRIANIHTAEFKPFVFPDGVALGDSVLQLDDRQDLGVGFHVYRMPAGMTTRSHRHNGAEQFLILEGELHESDGTILRAGDMVLYRDGTEHNSHTPTGCLLAVHITRPETPVD
jgi:mannose-6-phosphate isomerase-like protein (cupin superfamily)